MKLFSLFGNQEKDPIDEMLDDIYRGEDGDQNLRLMAQSMHQLGMSRDDSKAVLSVCENGKR